MFFIATVACMGLHTRGKKYAHLSVPASYTCFAYTKYETYSIIYTVLYALNSPISA